MGYGFRFWEMLAYLANTIIFFLVGMLITIKAINETSADDWFFLASLYFAVFAIRYSSV